MFQWTRNTKGRLVKTSSPQESDCAVNLNSNPVEPPHEEQQVSREWRGTSMHLGP